MDNLLPLITGGTGALVVLALWVYAFYVGKIHSDRDYSKLETDNADLRAANDKLTEALALERQRSNDATQAGTVTNQLIGGLVKLATEHRAADRHEHQDATDLATEHRALERQEHQDAADAADARALHPAALDLSAKDLGL